MTDFEVQQLRITVTGPAARRAPLDRLSTSDLVIVPTSSRCAVVLVLVDGTLAPTRADIDLVSAVSQATGRCAVGLVGCDSPVEDGALVGGDSPNKNTCAFAWRKAIPSEIPVGGVDSAMGATLALLAEGPARAHGRAIHEYTASLLRRQLSQEQARRARIASTAAQHNRREVIALLGAALENIGGSCGDNVPRTAAELELACQDASSTLCGKLRTRLGWGEGDFRPTLPIPQAPSLPRRALLVDIVLGIVLLGATIGAGKILAQPLGWLGIAQAMMDVLAIIVGIMLAVVVSGTNIRRKVQQEQRAWVVGYVASVRKQWEPVLLDALAQRAEVTTRDWRTRAIARELATHTRR